MRAFSIFRRSLRQALRDRLGLALTLLTAPFFVLFYWAVFDTGEEPTPVCVRADDATVQLFRDLEAIEVVKCGPEAVVEAVVTEATPVELVVRGDATDPRFGPAAQALYIALESGLAVRRGQSPNVAMTITPDEGTDDRTPFDLYVPNLVLFSLIMLVFSSAMALSREVERGTLERLRLTKMRTVDYVIGMSATQLIIGFSTAALTLAVAVALGFRPSNLAMAAPVAACTALACIGLGVVLASFARTVSRAFVLASFFMFLMVLFSGIVFPVPDTWVFDVIPTVHGARAFDAVLIRGADASEIFDELFALGISSIILFIAGALRFRWLHRNFLEAG